MQHAISSPHEVHKVLAAGSIDDPGMLMYTLASMLKKKNFRFLSATFTKYLGLFLGCYLGRQHNVKIQHEEHGRHQALCISDSGPSKIDRASRSLIHF